MSSIFKSLCIISLFFQCSSSKASEDYEFEPSPPISSEMIEQGLTTWVKYSNGLLEKFASNPQDMFMLKQIYLPNHNGHQKPILEAHVLRGGKGFIHFFKWMTKTSDTANYEMIDQQMYQSGHVDQLQENYLGSIHYELGTLRSDTFAETEEKGYFRLYLSHNPIHYCHIQDLIARKGNYAIEIGSKLISELCDFIFKTKTAKVVLTQVPHATEGAHCVYTRNGFQRKKLSLDPQKPNYNEYLLHSVQNDMISLTRGRGYFVPIFDKPTPFNKYLSRLEWKKSKQTNPDTQDDAP